MESYIKIDSISIDLANSVDKSTDAEKCEHFSIRGYVSEIRENDWKKCWPFPLQDNHSASEEQPSLLPPLDVPKFRWWCCRNCQRETAVAEGTDKEIDRTDFICCSSGCRSDSNCISTALRSDNQQAPMPVRTLEGREIDLNNAIDLSCGSDHLPINDEKEKKDEVPHSKMIDLEIGLGDNLTHQITSVSSPEIYPGLSQEAIANDRGCEGNELAIVTSPKCMAKSSAEIYNGGTTASADDPCQKELRKPRTGSVEGTTIATEADNTAAQRTRNPPLEPVACHYTAPESTDILAENDFQDHHLEKSTGLPRRKPRKVRLLSDLLSENVKTKTDHVTKQEFPSNGTSSASAALQTPSISQGKGDVRGDLKSMSQSIRKRKSLLDAPTEMCSRGVENEVMNLEGNAEAIDTALDAGSKDVPAGIVLQDATKSGWSKPENERSHTMGKKKNKKIQVLDSHRISEPYQGQQIENQDNMVDVNKVYASKTVSTKVAPHAFTEKGLDNFPLHGLRTESYSNLSKGKGKMLQVDRELASLSCQKNNMLIEDSYAYAGAKIQSNMPAAVPIPSAQGALNENGLHLSLNSILASQVYNQKYAHQIESRPSFSLPFQEGTSKAHQLARRDRETDFVGGLSIHSKHMRDAKSGKGVFIEEITDARDTGKTAEALEQVGIMKKYGDQTAEKVSEQGTVDDIPMEIVELMAKNQYERCLPDAEIRNQLLEKSTIKGKAQMTDGTGELRLLQEGQKKKAHTRYGKNGMVSRGENVRPSKRKSVPYFSPFDSNHLNMNSLNQPHSTFGVEVSQTFKKPSGGFHFSHSGPSHLGSAQNFKFNGGTTERGSFDATQVQGGCSLHKTILQHDDEASRIWASLTPNHRPLGYDIPRKVISQSTSSNMDMNSHRSGTLHKHNMKRDIDLNYLNLNAADLGKRNRNMDPGTFSRMTPEYSFPSKHNGIESHQNLRRSLDLYSNETIPAMHLLSLMDAGMQSGAPFSSDVSAQMLKRPSYPSDCDTKLEIGTSHKALGSQKWSSSDYYSSHGCFLDSSTIASSSVQHDGKFVRATDFSGQISSKSGRKDKMKSSNSAKQNNGSKCIERESPHDKLEVHGTSGALVPVKNSCVSSTCSINRNPADFTIPERGNVYMIRGEDLKFEKASIPQNRPGSTASRGCKQQRNLKRSKIKEHAKN